jgi:hypothetical protein
VRRQRLSERGKYDQDKLHAVHLLSTDNISKDTETDLTDDSAGGRSDLDGGVGIGGYLAWMDRISEQ